MSLTSVYAIKALALSPRILLGLDASWGLTDLSGNGNDGTAVGGLTVGGYSPSPFAYGVDGATAFDGSNDAVTTDYGTRRNFAARPLSRPGAPMSSLAYQATRTVVAAPGESGNPHRTKYVATGLGQFGARTADVPCVAGEKWTISVNVFRATPDGLVLGMAAKDANDTVLSYNSSPAIHGTGRLSWTVTMPPSAAKFYGYVYAQNGTNGIGEYVEMDGLLLEQADSMGDFFPTPGQLASGEAGWLGTPYESQSDKGCFANGTARTFTGWLRPKSSAGAMVVWGNGSGPDYDISLRIASDGSVGFFLGTTQHQFSGAPFATRGVWYHAAVVIDEPADTASLYIDGALWNTKTSVTGQWASGGTVTQTNLKLGLYGGQYFNGQMSSVAVHERALTADEILALYETSTDTAPIYENPVMSIMPNNTQLQLGRS